MTKLTMLEQIIINHLCDRLDIEYAGLEISEIPDSENRRFKQDIKFIYDYKFLYNGNKIAFHTSKPVEKSDVETVKKVLIIQIGELK